MRIADRPLLRPALVVLSLGFGVAGFEGSVTQRQTQKLTIAVERARPLADVVETLQDRLGVVITYEDPPYLHASQVRDASEDFRGASRTFIPRGGPFSFSYELPQGTPEEQAARILDSLVEQYRGTGYPGNFRIERTGSVFHVVPTEHRSRAGQDEPFQPILSTPLQFQPTGTEQSALEALQHLVDALGRANNIRVGLATIPTNVLHQTKVTTDFGTRTAREELVRILAATGRQLSWRLMFDPNEPQTWFLNISIVR